ncbi:MAG TPA: ankyrin repeat domain-containing protein, partial [Chthoniobacterales bacterium]
MSATKTRILLATCIVAGILLLAGRFAPHQAPKAELPPDSFARAIATANPHLLEIATAHRLDVNARGEDGRTPLQLAMERGDAALIERLLQLGGSVDAADEAGVTPLMLAAGSG